MFQSFLLHGEEFPLQVREVELGEGEKIVLVPIEKGSFSMGSPIGERGRGEDEDSHRVTISESFWIGQTEVTIGQWKQVMGETLREHLTAGILDTTLHDFDGEMRTMSDYMNMSLVDGIDAFLANEDDDLPMYFASWYDAVSFCEKLTSLERSKDRLPAGFVYSLPTEAQWEYAVRAGTSPATFAGDLSDLNSETFPLEQYAWYESNSSIGYIGKSVGPNLSGPRKVGTKLANPWGLHDMTGNLWEWCSDWYGPYPQDELIDPMGPAVGNRRVNRGGSFGSSVTSERSAKRAANPPAEASAWRGFRIVMRISM